MAVVTGCHQLRDASAVMRCQPRLLPWRTSLPISVPLRISSRTCRKQRGVGYSSGPQTQASTMQLSFWWSHGCCVCISNRAHCGQGMKPSPSHQIAGCNVGQTKVVRHATTVGALAHACSNNNGGGGGRRTAGMAALMSIAMPVGLQLFRQVPGGVQRSRERDGEGQQLADDAARAPGGPKKTNVAGRASEKARLDRSTRCSHCQQALRTAEQALNSWLRAMLVPVRSPATQGEQDAFGFTRLDKRQRHVARRRRHAIRACRAGANERQQVAKQCLANVCIRGCTKGNGPSTCRQ